MRFIVHTQHFLITSMAHEPFLPDYTKVALFHRTSIPIIKLSLDILILAHEIGKRILKIKEILIMDIFKKYGSLLEYGVIYH